MKDFFFFYQCYQLWVYLCVCVRHRCLQTFPLISSLFVLSLPSFLTPLPYFPLCSSWIYYSFPSDLPFFPLVFLSFLFHIVTLFFLLTELSRPHSFPPLHPIVCPLSFPPSAFPLPFVLCSLPPCFKALPGMGRKPWMIFRESELCLS